MLNTSLDTLRHLQFSKRQIKREVVVMGKYGFNRKLKTRLIILTTFLVRTITTRTLLDGTPTVTLIPTLRRTSTPVLLRQRLYRTPEAPLKLLHVYYNLTIYVLQTNAYITTLRRLLTNVKDKDKPEDRQGAVYKIKCCDYQASYIGETGRNLSTRLTEHKRATRNGDVNNHIAEHHFQTKHQLTGTLRHV